MYEQFKARAVGVGAEVHRVATCSDAVEFVLSFLKQEGVSERPGSYAVWAKGPFLDAVGQGPLAGVPGLGFEVTEQVGAAGRYDTVGAYGWGSAYYSKYWVDPAEKLVAESPSLSARAPMPPPWCGRPRDCWPT